MADEREIKVKSLQKALEILGCFVEKQPLGVTEISEKLGLYKSNVHNILMTFKAMDYLEQDSETGKFRLGTAVFSLSRALKESLSISRIALPFMNKIAEETRELVYLAIPREDEVVYLEAIYPERQMLTGVGVTGERAKMYCTSVGKAILSRLPDEQVEMILNREKTKLTEYTIIDNALLWEEIRKARREGYAEDNMEYSFGVKCVGVPLMNHLGRVEAAISISTPSLRMSDEKKEHFVQILKRYAAEIEKRL